MLETPTDTAAAKKALVRSYATPSYYDPWDSIQDFDRVQRYTAEHPNQGSQAVSTALDLPRSRIRPWLDGSEPDCYRGLQTALMNDWIADEWNESTRALNELAAWLLASGSINDNWTPLFVADDECEVRCFQGAAARAGVAFILARDDRNRPEEWRPRRDATILGRVLHTWTGLKGDKSSDSMQFPCYPQLAPIDVVRSFAATYVNLRAIPRDDREGPRIQMQEHRSDQYRRALVALLERVASDPDDIRGDSWPVYVVGDTVAKFQWDE